MNFPQPQVGEIYEELRRPRPLLRRLVKVLYVDQNLPSLEKHSMVKIQRCNEGGSPVFGASKTWAKKSRFNGKSGGYKLVPLSGEAEL